jgi:hypothetical protein
MLKEAIVSQKEPLIHISSRSEQSTRLWTPLPKLQRAHKRYPTCMIPYSSLVDNGLGRLDEVECGAAEPGAEALIFAITESISVDLQLCHRYREIASLQRTVLMTTMAMKKCRECALAAKSRFSTRVELDKTDRSSLLTCL